MEESNMDKIEKRIEGIANIQQLKDELKLLWRIVYPHCIASEDEKKRR